MGLETVEIVLWAEREFDIEIPDNEASDILTIGQFVSYISNRSNVKFGLKAPSKEVIFEKLKNLLIIQYKTPPEWVKPEMEFYKDLGLG